jgi:hypothetical protein
MTKEEVIKILLDREALLRGRVSKSLDNGEWGVANMDSSAAGVYAYAAKLVGEIDETT